MSFPQSSTSNNPAAVPASAGAQGAEGSIEDDQALPTQSTQSTKNLDSHSCTSSTPLQATTAEVTQVSRRAPAPNKGALPKAATALPIPESESKSESNSSGNPIFKSVRSAWKKAKVRGRWRRSIDLEQARKERDQENNDTSDRTATHAMERMEESKEDALFYSPPNEENKQQNPVDGATAAATTTSSRTDGATGGAQSLLVSVPSAPISIDQSCTVCIRFHPETTQSIRVSVNPAEQKRISRANYQVDYVNHLIPHLQEIFSCPFYLGKMDRYEAEALLACKPEGSFLLRDSAQENYVFSVSFRRYSRSLHARIEETNHKFSFDCHDPGVHASRDIRGLLDFYKDPLSCMFFEPMLLFPILRKKTFSLQELARTVICDNTTYDGIAELPIPKTLHQFLREYHYKHKVESRALELNPSSLNLPNSSTNNSEMKPSTSNLDVMPK